MSLERPESRLSEVHEAMLRRAELADNKMARERFETLFQKQFERYDERMLRIELGSMQNLLLRMLEDPEQQGGPFASMTNEELRELYYILYGTAPEEDA